MSAAGATGYFVYGIVLFGLTEELAWRGFALPRMQAMLPALTSSLLLGAIWGVWHTPTFLLPSEGDSALPYPGFLLWVLAQSVLTTWIFNRTGGSVLLAAIFHAASDATYAYSGAVGGDARLFWIAVVLSWVLAVLVVVAEGPATLAGRARRPKAAAPVPATADLVGM